MRAYGKVSQRSLDGLQDGIEIDGIQYGPVKAKLDQYQGGNVWITLSINEGKNREVRTLMRHLGLHVNRLIRTAYGPFQLGKLPKESIEEIPGKQLREQLGKNICSEIGL